MELAAQVSWDSLQVNLDFDSMPIQLVLSDSKGSGSLTSPLFLHSCLAHSTPVFFFPSPSL